MLKANLILAIIAFVLAIPTALTLWSEGGTYTDVNESKLLLAGFTRTNVRGVGISVPVFDAKGELERDDKGGPKRKISQFLRTNEGWRLADDVGGLGPPVQDETIYERVFQHLESIRSDEKSLVLADATNEQLARYGLDEDHAVEVRCVDGAQPQPRLLAELLIGKDASAGRVGKDVVHGFYVRTRDSNDVVLYEQDYWLLDPDPRTWVDRNPVRFAVDDVIAVGVRSPKGEFAVARKNVDAPDWEKVKGPDDVGAPNNIEIRALLQGIRSIDIQEYRDRIVPGPEFDKLQSERGFDTPMIKIDFELAGGTRYRIDVGRQIPNKNEYWLRISTIDFLMTAGDWVTTRFDRDPANYFGPAPSKKR